MSLVIREFTPEDYPALVAINNAVEPEYPESEEEWRAGDAHRDPKCLWKRWVVEREGAPVAFGGYHQWSGMYHPRKFHMGISVHPEHQGRGVGTALYETILTALEPLDPLCLRTGAREDRQTALRFLANRGFEEEFRAWESRLDLGAFDPSPYDGHVEQVKAGGIEIRTMKELASDPERDRKLYEMIHEVEEDIPSPDQITKPDFDHWLERLRNSPNLLEDAWFIAVDSSNGRYAGISQLWASKASNVLYTGLTGIRREYRRKGIAMALKLCALEYARRQGCPEVRTWNAQVNAKMLAINVRLGFVKQPAWIDYVKNIKPE
jgi:mycothiol synthase